MGLHALKTPQKDLYLLIDRVKTGPLTIDEVLDLFHKQKIVHSTPLWYPGLLNWVTVGDMSDLNRRQSSGPPPIPAPSASSALWIHFQNQVIAMSVERVQQLVKEKKFRRGDYAYYGETQTWIRADQHPLLTSVFSPGVSIPTTKS
jgi:hypothetical protein